MKPLPGRYVQVHDGEWFRVWQNERHQCCGCCLIHVIRYKTVDGQTYIQFTTDQKATLRARKRAGIRIIKRKP